MTVRLSLRLNKPSRPLVLGLVRFRGGKVRQGGAAGWTSLVRPSNVPPSDIAAPEQANLDGGEYDLFKADVFNLGRTLMIELQGVLAVSFIPLVS